MQDFPARNAFRPIFLKDRRDRQSESYPASPLSTKGFNPQVISPSFFPLFQTQIVEMLTFEKCKKILTSQGEKYSDDEIKIVMNVLFQLACFEYQSYKNYKSKNGQSNIVYTRKFGGTK